MKVIKSLNEIKDDERKVVLTIGNFDGVHKGHREILSKIKKFSEENNLIFAVMTFVPHPMQILNPQNNFLLNSYDEKRELIKETGVDVLLEIDFNRDLSTMQPDSFIDQYILDSDNVSHFFIGHDFAFGANKKGNYDFIKSYCTNKDIEVIRLDKFVEGNTSVSSSKIRSLVDTGNITEANELLGRRFFLSGRIIKGAGRGKKIGIPTANLSFDQNRKAPKNGVYISRTRVGDQYWHSITNIGSNPTFNDEINLFVETHIFDFDNDIYGEEIRVEIIDRIRDEKKFSSVNDLIMQIKSDITKSREYFKNA